ncbi:MAG: SDR family oxidoreductase [Candidatus Zixiibacteriota bacterium]
MISLRDKIVVVTGASKGIGAAIAELFAADGARVVLTARSKSALDESLSRLGGERKRHLVVRADLRKQTDLKRVISLSRKSFGRIDIWINNAGVGAHKPVTETSEREYDAIMDTNVRAVFYSLRALVPVFRGQKEDADGCRGQIINISSSAARIGVPNLAVYSASKGALNLLSESVANEVRNEGIKISVFSPASTDTDLMRNLSKKKPNRALSPSKASVKLTPLEVAEGVLFLAKQNVNAWTSFADIRPLSVRR